MRGVGAERTRHTYLAVLRPWFGFLSEHQYAWNARPDAVREYTRLFLLDAGCALKAGRVDGWFVQATNKSPISTNGLHLVIAALRNFYEVMRRGVFDPEDQRLHPLYPFENPMYSQVLLAWRAEHRKWIRHYGAPDYAGIRSRSRADAARQPVGFFQVKRQPLEPPVARDSEPTRLVILAGVHYMIDRAPPRDAVILRILLESGARVSEILGLTAQGLRQAHNPTIGIDVAAFVRNKGDQVASKPIWCSAETREQLRRYIARERSRLDSRGRTRVDQLGDDEDLPVPPKTPAWLFRVSHHFQSAALQSAAALRGANARADRDSGPAACNYAAHHPPPARNVSRQAGARIVHQPGRTWPGARGGSRRHGLA